MNLFKSYIIVQICRCKVMKCLLYKFDKKVSFLSISYSGVPQKVVREKIRFLPLLMSDKVKLIEVEPFI